MKTLEVSDDYLIKEKLMIWRLELYSATQILKGDNLESFKKLITEIATVCHLEVSDTGTFIRPSIDEV